MVEPSPPPIDERILKALRRISRAVDQYSRSLATRYELTGPQLVCLRQLVTAGPWTSSKLAVEVSLSQPTITGIIDRLAKRQLVTRVRDDADRRRVFLEVTDAGRALVEKAPSPLQDRFAANLARLGPDEQQRIGRVLETVVAMMEADEIDASPLMATGPVSATADEILGLLHHAGGT